MVSAADHRQTRRQDVHLPTTPRSQSGPRRGRCNLQRPWPSLTHNLRRPRRRHSTVEARLQQDPLHGILYHQSSTPRSPSSSPTTAPQDLLVHLRFPSGPCRRTRRRPVKTDSYPAFSRAIACAPPSGPCHRTQRRPPAHFLCLALH